MRTEYATYNIVAPYIYSLTGIHPPRLLLSLPVMCVGNGNFAMMHKIAIIFDGNT